jgi:molybdopterin-guanine dinucleotide biosynthesis protein A
MRTERVIVCCAGSAQRWGNYLGAPKHLVPVDGVPLIKRTVDQLRARGFTSIFITLPGLDMRYAVAQAEQVTPLPSMFILPDTGLGGSAAYWHQQEPTLVLLGDVAFSEAAMDTIAAARATDVTWFGRKGDGSLGKYGEIFAALIPVERQAAVRSAAATVVALRHDKLISRISGWELYAVLNNIDPTAPVPAANWINIDDETEGFDFREEYEAWMRKHRGTSRLKRSGLRCDHGLPLGVCCQR